MEFSTEWQVSCTGWVAPAAFLGAYTEANSMS